MRHVLWHDADLRIALIDGPASIEDAQGNDFALAGHRLISSEAISQPFPSQEPKTEAARQRLLASSGVSESSQSHVATLEQVLLQVKQSYPGPWALARQTPNPAVQINSATAIVSKAMQSSAKPMDEDPLAYEFVGPNESSSVYNDHQSMAVQVCEDVKYFIPAKSAYMVLDFTYRKQIAALHAEIRSQASEYDLSRKFNMMILDPPWKNVSVRRKRKLYSTSGDDEMMAMLVQLDLDQLMARDCIVAVWITNKASARDTILGRGGFFDLCGIVLIEEWVWLKVTSQGEPVSNIESLWRKPYEVLLVGQRGQGHESVRSASTKAVTRVMMSVPDVHSRKPCLQYLMERAFNLPDDYRGMEVFARHLVKGWWSIGNESNKFNETVHWQKH